MNVSDSILLSDLMKGKRNATTCNVYTNIPEKIDYIKDHTNTITKEVYEIQKELATLYTIIHPQENLADFKNIALTRNHIKKIIDVAEYIECTILKLENELIEGEKGV